MEGVSGLDLLAYRYDGDVGALVRSVVGAVDLPVIVAGSMDSEERIRSLADAGVWGFTVGSAIFDGRFARGASLREQVQAVFAGSRPGAPWNSYRRLILRVPRRSGARDAEETSGLETKACASPWTAHRGRRWTWSLRELLRAATRTPGFGLCSSPALAPPSALGRRWGVP